MQIKGALLQQLSKRTYVLRLGLLVAVVNIAVLLIFGFSMMQSRAQIQSKAEVDSANLASLLAQHWEATLQKIDLVLLAVSDAHLAQLKVGKPDPTVLAGVIARQAEHFPELNGIRITNVDGLLVYGRAATKNVSLADRDYFIRLRDDPKAGLLISKPTVRNLKRLGVTLSIDDFGTGYSSLSYLKRFDVEKLKIDQLFIHDLTSDQNDAAIVRAIIQMAHSLGLRTIAEGVESEQLLAALHDFNCDEAQGYHFARPMPAREFADYLRQRL